MSDITIERAREAKEFFGHPRGLVICFLTEMWERFSYYGMRALLIFYLTKHFLFSDQTSAGIYAAYTALVYVTPTIGGIIADKYLGASRAVILGAILLVIGHFGMAFEGHSAGETIVNGVRIVKRDPFFLQTFYLSLAFIIAGSGFLKANISTIVGGLYKTGDARRDGGFTIFYMGINLGAFISAIVCGYLGETYGWAYGFGAAGVGMLLGLVIFIAGQGWLEGKAAPHNPAVLKENFFLGLNKEWAIYGGAVLLVIFLWQLIQYRVIVDSLVMGSLVFMVSIVIAYSIFKCEPHERDRMLVILFLMSYQVLFWGLFEQAGSSLNLMADRNVDRMVLGFEIPASTFQSVNAFFIIILAPLFSMMWVYLSKKGWEPSTPMKFALSLFQVGLGFLVMVFGASVATNPAEVALIWLILLYFLHTTGELCMSPVGLSMVTKLSVPKIMGMMMGCWFLASALGNIVSGKISKLTGSMTIGGEVTDKAAALANYMDVYEMVGYYSIGAGVIAVFLVPILRKAMHGIH